MGVVILLFAKPVGYIAMPALAGLLITVGIRTIKPGQIATVLRTGRIQQTVLLVTFVLTMLIPLQFAVLIGVGTSMILYVLRQSNQISLQRLRIDDERHVIDDEPPDELPADTVVLLEPVGSLFFAAAPAFEAMLPTVTDQSSNSVVVIRLRGRDDVGATLIDVFVRYASALHDVESKLVLASVQPRRAGPTESDRRDGRPRRAQRLRTWPLAYRHAAHGLRRRHRVGGSKRRRPHRLTGSS